MGLPQNMVPSPNSAYPFCPYVPTSVLRPLSWREEPALYRNWGPTKEF